MALRHHHFSGVPDWLRCDHDGTRLHVPTASLRLAERPEPKADPVDVAAWRAARGGAVATELSPALCPEPQENWRLAAPGSGTVAWRGGVWKAAEPGEGEALRSLVRDACARIWGLAADGRSARAWAADDLRLLDTIALPASAAQIAVSDLGVYALAEGGALWFGAWGRAWAEVAHGLDEVRAVAAHGAAVAVLGVRAGAAALARLEAARVRQVAAIELASPLPLAVLPDGRVLVGTVTGPPPRRTRFKVYTWSGAGANPVETREVAGFDGRGLHADADGAAWASSAAGWRRLYRVHPELVTTGRFETFALDSERYGCVWHRVFLDVCLPAGTSVRVEARTADTPWPQFEGAAAWRPRAPQGATWDERPKVVLGSRSEDDEEGWVDAGALDLVPLRADLPDPPRGELPALDPLPRGEHDEVAATHTVEALLKNMGGRYLWLRVHLRGTRRATPVVAGLRAWHARPSLLAFLPSFWRAEPAAAKRMDELLSLFEAPLTRLEQRIDVLPSLFDPRATPPEALEWLASFVALAFDQRVREGVRRTLLAEATTLWRRRGTVPGLERLCQILAEADVQVVEAWRLRAGHAGVIGAVGSLGAVMGPALELGGTSAPDPEADGDDAVRAWFRRTAHRFSVIVYRACDPELAAVLERAIELAKPAHTVHDLCWMDGGARLGGNTYVGVSLMPGSERPPTATLRAGDADEPPAVVLGAATLSRGSPAVTAPPPPLPPRDDA